MKFIMLYGPPAVGKLTVAKELQKLSKYKLFHNHMLVDLIDNIDEERSDDFSKTYISILKSILKYSIKRDVNLINTFVYGKDVDDDFMKTIKNTVTESGGDVIFIQLKTDKESLLQRVTEDSRKQFNKLKDPTQLKKFMEKYDLTSSYSKNDIQIDNTNKTPTDVAKVIWEIINT